MSRTLFSPRNTRIISLQVILLFNSACNLLSSCVFLCVRAFWFWLRQSARSARIFFPRPALVLCKRAYLFDGECVPCAHTWSTLQGVLPNSDGLSAFVRRSLSMEYTYHLSPCEGSCLRFFWTENIHPAWAHVCECA